MGVALGEPWSEVAASLGDAGAKRAAGFIRAMEQPDRQKKAEAVAKELGVVALDVERLELAWG